MSDQFNDANLIELRRNLIRANRFLMNKKSCDIKISINFAAGDFSIETLLLKIILISVRIGKNWVGSLFLCRNFDLNVPKRSFKMSWNEWIAKRISGKCRDTH